ncbi:hypothetical protein ACSQ67_026302 [Phaseolus vulgaris]
MVSWLALASNSGNELACLPSTLWTPSLCDELRIKTALPLPLKLLRPSTTTPLFCKAAPSSLPFCKTAPSSLPLTGPAPSQPLSSSLQPELPTPAVATTPRPRATWIEGHNSPPHTSPRIRLRHRLLPLRKRLWKMTRTHRFDEQTSLHRPPLAASPSTCDLPEKTHMAASAAPVMCQPYLRLFLGPE